MLYDAAYARYSSHAQDDSTSIEFQIEACEKAAGGACVHYVDEARTGRAIAGRGAMSRLLEDAKRGKIRRVFVYKFNRIGRDLADSATIIRTLEDLRVEVVSATEGSDLFARAIFLAMAEHYSRELGQNTFNGLVKRFESGIWTGGQPPYGYRVVDGEGGRRLAIDSDESAVVAEVFRLYLNEGLGLKSLAQHLESRRISTRRGAAWSHVSVRGILTNRMLVGEVQFNRRRFHLDRETGRRVPVKKDPSEVMTFHDERLRIVNDEDFEAVQARLATHRNRPQGSAKGRRTIHVFTGLM